MTVKELASKMNELMRNGDSNSHVFMTVEGTISVPVLNVYKPKLPDNLIIITAARINSSQQESDSSV